MDRGIFHWLEGCSFSHFVYFPRRLSVVSLSLGTWALLCSSNDTSDNFRLFDGKVER